MLQLRESAGAQKRRDAVRLRNQRFQPHLPKLQGKHACPVLDLEGLKKRRPDKRLRAVIIALHLFGTYFCPSDLQIDFCAFFLNRLLRGCSGPEFLFIYFTVSFVLEKCHLNPPAFYPLFKSCFLTRHILISCFQGSSVGKQLIAVPENRLKTLSRLTTPLLHILKTALPSVLLPLRSVCARRVQQHDGFHS